MIILDDPGHSEKKKYKAERVASDADIAATGGEKTLAITNLLFQSDADADVIAVALLARLKDRKEYFESSIEFCPVPLERRDTVLIQERITHTKSMYHTGLVRHIKLEVTPTSQRLTLTLEE